ncbi:MAG: glycosyltransferase family 8 protein [Clostridia bacterium]|nr:glycosyltransferase family 8 protein [Clostridia bacterium]
MKLVYEKTIPVFFAVDDRYAPFLGVALRSMLANADRRYFYRIHVLTTGLSEENMEKLRHEETENARISFDDISRELSRIASELHMRDYYSAATYYRIFIGSIYREYDRVLYFDSDLVFCGDIAKMYHADIGRALVGAVADDVLTMEPVFGDYAEAVLDVPRERYFNAGILLIDLARYRATHMEERFISLLRRRKFTVAQDQDYLNVLTKNAVYYFDGAWNRSAAPCNAGRTVNIVHYKMNWKPWHHDGVAFEQLFWQYADACAFAEDIRAIKRGYTLGDKLRDKIAGERLVLTAREEIAAARATAQTRAHNVPPCHAAEA